jgi:predicted nuclease with TOPRIM domain
MPWEANVSITEVLMKDKRKAYEEKLDAQLKEWNAQIALLKAKAENAKADAKVDHYKTIETLESKQDEAKTRLQELRNSGDDAWEDLKTGAENVWTEIKAAFQSATSRFK